MPLILILLLAVFQCSITNYLITNPDYYQLGPYSWESNDFRAMRLGDVVATDYGYDWWWRFNANNGMNDTGYYSYLPYFTQQFCLGQHQ